MFDVLYKCLFYFIKETTEIEDKAKFYTDSRMLCKADSDLAVKIA